MPHPYLIGENPSRTGDRYHRLPLSGAPAKVLCQCAGWPPDGEGIGGWTWALYDRFATMNVFERWADSTPWDTRKARLRAEEIVATARGAGTPSILLLGRKVAGAFGLESVDYFHWVPWGELNRHGIPLVVLPHPSGRNLLMNDKAMRDRVGATLRQAVAGQLPGAAGSR